MVGSPVISQLYFNEFRQMVIGITWNSLLDDTSRLHPRLCDKK